MAIELHELDDGRVLHVQVSGKLGKDDYDRFVPEVDRLIQSHGTIRILFEMHDFHGWSAGTLWADTRFAIRHFSDIERLAMIGETRWQRGMAMFCKPFSRAAIRYFEHDKQADALSWIEQALTVAK